jgi:ribonucleoside-diphosphate reductase alpha chain
MLSPNALTVLEKRYFKKDDAGRALEDAAGMFRRVARTLAAPDARYGASDSEVAATEERFYGIMSRLEFLPNSPTLANAGVRDWNYSACFVLPVADSLGAIFDALKWQALIHQTGGGTGFAFSRIRPKNDLVASTKGVASGPVSFARIFNCATEQVKQGGMRRGANMGILRVDHPDIEEFVDAKADLAELTNFNVSVAITDAFMAAVESGEPFALVNPRTGAVAKHIDARTLFRRIVERAWATGEPGVVFLDRANAYCPVPWLGLYEATNPCSEQFLLPFESCNLGSINLERFVTYDFEEPPYGHARFDWDRLREVVAIATHLLDNVIDANHFPIPELERMAKATRKIGLGLMGFARTCFRLGIPYGGPESLAFAGRVMSLIDHESKRTSVGLAVARGQFPARDGHEAESNAIFKAWCEERQAHPHRHPECDYLGLAELIARYGIRNSNTTTVAPTGTLSIIADTSGGCEPVFALAFKRFQADAHMIDRDAVFEEALTRQGIDAISRELVFELIDKHHGSLAMLLASDDRSCFAEPELEKLDRLATLFLSAHDVTPEQHVRIQAAFQAFNDSSVSKTCNFAGDATVDDVEIAYRLAYSLGCKGVTVYRDGSREAQPLSTGTTKHKLTDGAALNGAGAASSANATHHASAGDGTSSCVSSSAKAPRVRAEDLYGFNRRVMTGDGKLYVAVNYDEHGIREVMATVGRSGGTLFSLTEAIGRLVSLALQYHVPVDEIAKQLVGIRSSVPHGFGPNQVLSIPDAIGKVLRNAPRVLGFGPSVAAKAIVPAAASTAHHAVEVMGHSPECPDCGARLDFGEGCSTCHSCGWSKCS